jgi:hypothetical protein
MTGRYVDLHVHTTYSDGSFSPEEVVRHASERGFAAIGIADHDEVGGVTEAIWKGHHYGVEIVPAVELTSGWDGKEIHLLGYLIDHNNRGLREQLKEFRYHRFKRMELMVDRLRKLGLKVRMEAVRRVAGHGSLGRLHLARTLFQMGIVTTVQEAFDRYIGVGKPAYVKKPRLEAAEACELIASAGGIPTLAHPKLAHVDESIPRLVNLGVRGIEVYYIKHTPGDIERYRAIAADHGLLITGGSDCHGLIRDSMLLGSIKVPYSHLIALREEAASAL